MLVIECPKRSSDNEFAGGETYSYYAGYSLRFAEQMLANLPLDADALILDPWNGSGTTTVAATRVGFRSVGFDLNPVMVVVARARMLGHATLPSVLPIWEKIKSETIKRTHFPPGAADPLCDWLTDGGIRNFRAIEESIKGHLVQKPPNPTSGVFDVHQLSDVAAFFYVALFRVAKRLTTSFTTSNPTWVRRSRSSSERIPVALDQLLSLMEIELKSALNSRDGLSLSAGPKFVEAHVSLCNSESLSLEGDSVDVVLTSPPYCTRIDYAVATSIELAVLGYQRRTTFTDLRDSLMGTTTVPKSLPKLEKSLGRTCARLLRDIGKHESVASDTYYLKNHLRYFVSLRQSLAEVARVLKPQGIATFVVQDSAYKELHNDLPMILSEMCEGLGLFEFQRDDFSTGISLSSINTRSRRYKPKGFKPTESVISFYKQ